MPPLSCGGIPLQHRPPYPLPHRLPPPLLWTNYQSIRELKEFDCVSRQHRSLKTMLFANHLTKGDPLYGYESAGTFGPVAAAALDEAQFQFACK